jgi:uncharacterized protein
MFIRTKALPGLTLLVLCCISGFATDNDLGVVDAVKNQDKDALHRLLREHINVNMSANDGTTALHWAAHWDDLDTADLLIRSGANVNATTDLDVTPLYVACERGSARMVAKLLAAKANPNIASATGVTPLMQAARSGCVDAVQTLLDDGANMSAMENSQGQTALMWAAAQRHAEVVRILVTHGVDVHVRSRSHNLLVNISGGGTGEDAHGPSKLMPVGGSTALLFAARSGCIECASVLLNGGANINVAAPDGNSALVLAAHSGQGAFAKFLLERGANPDAAGAGYTALHAAILRGDLELLKALLAHGANPNSRLMNGTPTRRQGPDYALPESLVGASPFLLAAKYASVDMMRILFANGADLKLIARDGTTPLLAAAGANQRTGGDVVNPPAEESRALETVRLVLDLGGGVNAVNLAGDTALHIAASRGYATVVQLLAERGAALNVRNKLGKTPLSLAVARRRNFVLVSEPEFKKTADLLRKLGAVE